VKTARVRLTRPKNQGIAIVTALAVSVIVAIVLGGVGTLAVSHFTTAQKDTDYAAAMAVAEAGANYELWYISNNHLTNAPAHQSSAPYTGTIPNMPGSFTVYVTNSDGSSPWAPPSAMLLISTGTVQGVSRKIQLTGTRKSIFDEWAIYSLQNTTFNGSGSVVNGSLGTNGSVTSSSSGSAAVNGNLIYGHSPAVGDLTGSNVSYGPSVEWPTIDQIITSNPPVGFGSSGWGYLTSNSPVNRANPLIRTFAASGAAWTPAGTEVVGNPWTGNGVNALKIRPSDFNQCRTDPADGMKTIILVPGDYYFTDIDTGGGTGNKIVIDNAGLTTGTPGTVRIWMNSSTNNDTINVNVSYTSTDPSKFRLYYNKCANISIGGNSVYYGGFYAVRTGCTGSIEVTGGSTINGSLIANYFTISGGSTINFPSEGSNDNSGDFGIWYGFKDTWKEVVIPGAGSVFSDGSSN